jgi:lipopolysaccharide export system protein LptA
MGLQQQKTNCVKLSVKASPGEKVRNQESLMNRTKALICLAAAAALVAQAALPPRTLASDSDNDNDKSKTKTKTKIKPSGTLLLPLTPKIDDGRTYNSSVVPAPASAPATAAAATTSTKTSSAATAATKSKKQVSGSKVKAIAARPSTVAATSSPASASAAAGGIVKGIATSPTAIATAGIVPATDLGNGVSVPVTPQLPTGGTTGTKLNTPLPKTPVQVDVAAQESNEEGETAIDENSLLKGTVQIVADDTEFDEEKNTFLGTGNAVALIAGQDSKLEADSILYDQNNGTLDARGNVKIVRNGQITMGSSLKFQLNSDEYLITNPDTELSGTLVQARTGKGNDKGVLFRNGTLQLPKPLNIMNNAYYGGIGPSERVSELMAHPEAYVPQKPSYKFKARKMYYEKYKDEGQLTVFGGRLAFDHFTIPIGNFVANVGGENTRVTFPVLPVLGNNMQVGGENIGPQYNYAVGKSGAFSWAPLLQIGGSSISSTGATQSNGDKLGLGAKISYSSDNLSTHFAYGSVSKLAVADFKYRISKKTLFQAGVNRYLNDGMFGMRRAGKIAEFVDNRGIGTIPFIGYLNFRTSAGWAQDNPGLLGLTSAEYASLFNTTGTKSGTSAFRFQEQISANTHPLIKYGNAKYGAELTLAGGAAGRLYSTGNKMLMSQAGPMLTARLDRARLRVGYMQAIVSGSSPFVFDEFIQGTRSAFLQGDVRIYKWLTLGCNIGYNLVANEWYTKAVTAAIGPDDFKLMFTDDAVSGYQRFGFDILYGQKIPFDKLVVKGAPDAGQIGH